MPASDLYFEENIRLREIIAALTASMERVAVLVSASDEYRQCLFCGKGWRESRGAKHADDCPLILAKKAMTDPNIALGENHARL